MQQTTPQQTTFTDEEVRQASPERRAWYLRVLQLAHLTGAPVELARQAVEEADRQQSTK